MQHYITPLLGQIALTQPEGVLGHCPVEKQIIVLLSTNQMGVAIQRLRHETYVAGATGNYGLHK